MTNLGAQNAYQTGGGGKFSSGGDSASFFLPPVPLGKRLVVEHVTASALVPRRQKLRMSLSTRINRNHLGHEGHVRHALVLTSQGTFVGQDEFRASQPVRWYADVETQILVSANRNSTRGSGTVTASISGYLVDAPADGPRVINRVQRKRTRPV